MCFMKKMKMPRRKPDHVVKTCNSTMYFYVEYEQDPKKSREAKECIEHALRYIAEQGGLLDELNAYNKSLKKCTRLARKLKHFPTES